MTIRPTTAIYDEPLDEDDDLMTVEEYLGDVECGGFTDYDGYGKAVRNEKAARTCYWGEAKPGEIGRIFPSDGVSGIPEDATHIVWFNR